MEIIKKSEKKLKDYYVANMLKILVSLKNNIQIKEKLNEPIFNFTDENEIICYINLLSNNNSLIVDNSNILLKNFFQNINSYETTLKNIKNELLIIQKILLSNKEMEINDLFSSNNKFENNNNNNTKEKRKIYLALIQLDSKFNKLLKINWDSIDFKDYFRNTQKLKENITKIYSELETFL